MIGRDRMVGLGPTRTYSTGCGPLILVIWLTVAAVAVLAATGESFAAAVGWTFGGELAVWGVGFALVIGIDELSRARQRRRARKQRERLQRIRERYDNPHDN